MEVASRLLAASALIAPPTVFVVAWLYSAWSAKKSVLLSIAVTLPGLAGVLWLALAEGASPVLPGALLIVGRHGILALQLGSASCRDRGGQYGELSGGSRHIKKKKQN